MSAENQAQFAIRFYDGKAKTYNQTWHPDYAQRFSSYLQLSAGDHVLDIACGTGLLTFLAAHRVGSQGRVVGVDVTPSMLSQAKTRKEINEDAYSHVEFYEADAMNLDAVKELKKESFDMITVASALVLFPDPQKVITHWVTFLKPGGTLVVDSPHPRSFLAGMVLERTCQRLKLPIPYCRCWSTSEHALRQVLEDVGLEVEKVITLENQSGYGRRCYEDSDWDDHFVEKVVLGDVARIFADPETRRQAQAVFKEEWENMAVNGRVEEVDSVFLGIGRKSTDPQAAKTMLSGGCRCGNIRYTSSAKPTDITNCYCRACQQLSGSGFLPFVHVPTYALKFTESSTLKKIKLSHVGERAFCSSCGSPISMVYNDSLNSNCITMGSVNGASLKDAWPKVTKHIFLKEKAPWTILPDDGAPRFDGFSDGSPPVEAYAKPQ
ncbi:S-adenosyl-L-methionine-dependent methyltransferase [Sporormia fimetaria CBS 119925]|uniref:S-adenosyl-L-methionine-dependent methyltransferase n=1 Tax=Sporormia fimetaria CBS 119925 TaxID=1340428 RepID=A0A6A6VKF0_9PLEO|nr:S-adenosyl-L-methionine-dependent methyltransferase [Sporormia fimetaria CBS 119925]